MLEEFDQKFLRMIEGLLSVFFLVMRDKYEVFINCGKWEFMICLNKDIEDHLNLRINLVNCKKSVNFLLLLGQFHLLQT